MNESFSVGRALSLTMSITFRNFIAFALLAVLVSIPEILYVYFGTKDWGGEASLSDLMDLVWFVLKFLAIGFFCGALVISTYAYGVVRELKGQHASIGATLAQGFRRFFPVIGTALLLGLLVAVTAFGTGFVALRMGTFGQILVLCAIGAIWATYIAAIPAAVMEPSGMTGPLTRSSSLTQGRRGAIFATLAVLMGVKFVTNEIVGSMLVDEAAIMDDPDKMWDMMRTSMYATVVIDIVFSMFMAVLASVSYYLLRAEKEGTSADELAAVFE
jgi:hypothetical protein